MKRILSVFVTLSIVLTVLPTSVIASSKKTSDFSDLKGNVYYAEAAKDLLEMGILTGYADGTFKGDNTIKRCEMAVIVCKMLNKTESEINGAKKKDRFDDVGSDHWARGYINLAAKEGIINGDEYGFRPDDNVLYEEAIKMIVCTLGYGDNVKIDPKDWSKGYIEIAKNKGISTGTKGKKGTDATRGDVALMANNGLDTKDADGDGYNDFEDLNPKVAYKEPVILVHGWTSNSTAFGVTTGLSGSNSEYFRPSDDVNKEKEYTDSAKHKITNIKSGRLGYYLENTMSYKRNGNLFAFNYPNLDMVQYNGKRLEKYINNLTKDAQAEKDTVYYKYLFPTKAAKEKGEVHFILIGHSMGGLVSRYYIENLEADCVTKLITIDTPHYGSDLAYISSASSIKYSPGVTELRPDSTLFGGSVKSDSGWFNKEVYEYAMANQSPALRGNKNVSTKYYAIAGYHADFLGELSLGDNLKDKIFSFELSLDTKSKEAFKNSINSSLRRYSKDSSYLQLGEASGDFTVDYMSQLAIRFDGENIDCQKLEGAYMVVNTKTIADVFHSYINTTPEMHKCVKAIIEK